MRQAEQFDTLVLGGEQGGKSLAWPLASLRRQTARRVNVQLFGSADPPQPIALGAVGAACSGVGRRGLTTDG
jgi:hypothetical protein